MAQANIERSKEIAQNIRTWIAERNAKGDFHQWIQTSGPKAFKGIKRKDLAKLLGISTSTLNANQASVELKNAEYLWTSADAQKETESKNASVDTRIAKETEKLSKSKASKLEGDNSALQAENHLLRARLRRYEAIDELLVKAARAPRRPFEDD